MTAKQAAIASSPPTGRQNASGAAAVSRAAAAATMAMAEVLAAVRVGCDEAKTSRWSKARVRRMAANAANPVIRVRAFSRGDQGQGAAGCPPR